MHGVHDLADVASIPQSFLRPIRDPVVLFRIVFRRADERFGL